MGRSIILLVTFTVILVQTKMATFNPDLNPFTMTSATSQTVGLSDTADCSIRISRASVCSQIADKDTRDGTRDGTSTTTTTSISNEIGRKLCNGRDSPCDDDCRLSWNFAQRKSYLNLTFADTSRVLAGYFVIKNAQCEQLQWNFTFVNRNLENTTITQNVVSTRQPSDVDSPQIYWFNLKESLEASQIYVEYQELQAYEEPQGQRNGQSGENLHQQQQQQQQQRQPTECDSSPSDKNSLVLRVRLQSCVEVSIGNSTTSFTDSFYHSSFESDNDYISRETDNISSNTESSTEYSSAMFSATNQTSTKITQRATPSVGITGNIPSSSPLPQSNPPTPTLFPTTTLPNTPSLQLTLQPSTEALPGKPQQYKASFRIINQQYQSDLGQNNTESYKTLYNKIYQPLNASYTLTCGSLYRGITKVTFEQGSVIVNNWFEVLGDFSDGMKNASSTKLMVEFRKNGMELDPTSFNFEPDKSKETNNNQDNQLLIIVVVSSVFIVLFIVLTVTTVILVKTRVCRKSVPRETEAELCQTAENDARTGIPRTQLMWQTIPTLETGFDFQNSFLYEIPKPVLPDDVQSNGVNPSRQIQSSFSANTTASVSYSFSSSGSSSCSKECLDVNDIGISCRSFCHENRSGFHIPRPRTKPSPAAVSPLSSSRASRKEVLHQNDFSPVFPDYSEVTQEYFAGGTVSVPQGRTDSAELSPAIRSRPEKKLRVRTVKNTWRFTGTRDAVDFGNVFLPSASPFQLAPVHESTPRTGFWSDRVSSMAGGSGVTATSFFCGEDDTDAMGVQGIKEVDCVNNNARQLTASCDEGGSDNRLEPADGIRTADLSGINYKCNDRPTANSNLTNNSQTNLFASIFTKSPKKCRSNADNIHRSAILTLPNDAFSENNNLSTSDL